MNNTPRYPAPGVMLAIDTGILVREIHRLNEENQYLDMQVPSQWDRMIRNSDKIDLYSGLLYAYDTAIHSPFESTSRQGTPPPPNAQMLVGAVSQSMGYGITRPPAQPFIPVRKKHLTLVHSGPGRAGRGGGGNDAT